MPSKLASASAPASTPPPKKKKGGFFGCRSKSALDSLPRNARGDNAAINRLNARNVFPPPLEQHMPQPSGHSSSSTATSTPLTEEKGLLRLAELNGTTTNLLTQQAELPIKPLYAQEVVEGFEPASESLAHHHDEEQNNENSNIEQETALEEARDVLPQDVSTRPNTPGPIRSFSVTSKTGRGFRRSLSLKRSGSSASAKLIARAPPVSSADFADLPESSSSSSDLVVKSTGDMASIRKARGRHQIGVHQQVVPDISEDEYLSLKDIQVAPSTTPDDMSDNATPKGKTHVISMPELESMRAVAATLEGSDASFRFQPGPSTYTPKLQPPSPIKDHHTAKMRSESREDGQDTVPDLPRNNFWEPIAQESISGTGRIIPFQYVTNLSRPVSIASLRSFACPSTPPRISSRPTSPNGTYAGGLRSTKSFSVSPLKKQATFNGFPRIFFPNAASLKHSPSSASNESRQKPILEVIPALDFEKLHIQRQQRRIQHQPSQTEQEEEKEYVERELGHAATRSHTCSNCGTVEDSREFAAFVAKGKASRRTSVKNTIKASTLTPGIAAQGSLRKSKSVKQDTIGESTLKRWGLAEAFQSAAQSANTQGEMIKVATVKKQKKMVPGPGGGYITDTANVRWCSALDEIKKALAVDLDSAEDNQSHEEENETKKAMERADAVLSKLGVAA